MYGTILRRLAISAAPLRRESRMSASQTVRPSSIGIAIRKLVRISALKNYILIVLVKAAWIVAQQVKHGTPQRKLVLTMSFAQMT